MSRSFSSISPVGTVLVVDDESSVRAVTEAILKTNGADVHSAESGPDAVVIAEAFYEGGGRYTAVILDLTMPGGPSGFETLERLHEMDPHLPVIACSGYFQEDARDLCRAIGFAEILSKPFTPDVLSSVIRRVLASGNESSVVGASGKDVAESLS